MKRSKTLVIDASVFLSSFIWDEHHHPVSRRFIDRLKEQKICVFIPLTIICEVLQAYFRITHDQKATDRLYTFFIDWNLEKGLRIMNLEATFLVYFTAWHHLFNLKTADGIIALAAHRLGYPLVTWDKQLLTQSKKHIVCYTPEEFIKKYNF